MARTKFNTIRIEYAGADLVSGGMLADVSGALNGSTRYTTQAVAHLGADAVELDESGNLERECSVSVAVDYGSEGEMLADVMARQGFADGHQRGALRYVVEVPVNARVSVELEYLDGMVFPEFGIAVEGGTGNVVETFWENGLTAENMQEYVDFLNSGGPGSLQGVARAGWEMVDGSPWLTLEAIGEYEGEAGNALKLTSWSASPFSGDHDFEHGSDTTEYAFSAGLTGFEYSSTLGGGGLRVVFTYAFTAGGDADAGA